MVRVIRLTRADITRLQNHAYDYGSIGGIDIHLFEEEFDEWMEDYACENFCCACCGCSCDLYNEYSYMYYDEEEPE